jgi:type VI secretion system protein ImpL
MLVYAAATLVLLIYLVGVWILGSLLGLQGRDLWILRGGLALIGIIGAVVFVWFYTRISKRAAADGSALLGRGKESDLEVVLREAATRLKSSKLARGSRLTDLPVVFVVGDVGTGKTSVIAHSGLESDLLAGQLYETSQTVPIPTRSANVWYARKTLFVEAGGASLADSGWWSPLLRRFQPSKIRTLKGNQPPRAAVVCFSCDTFLQRSESSGTPGGIAGLTRNIRSCLEEFARVSGVSFPVYVLFTKADQIPFFAEFTRNLSNNEVSQVLGATLPLRSSAESGVYAEEETYRLNAAFNNLVLSLADKRPEVLAREHDSEKLGAIYEFPREVGKLRSPIVQFLVDLCRPSQLRSTPWLRGFYFSGVRAVVVNEQVRPASPQPAPDTALTPQIGATGMFKSGSSVGRAAATPPPTVGTRRVPQWTFLTHFFNDVLLPDPLAKAAGFSTKTNSLRHVLLASGAAICLLLSIALFISYMGNSALESEVMEAMRGIPAPASPLAAAPSASDLRKLETLRVSLEKLSTYRSEGVPWHLRWGLYVGAGLNSTARSLYFKRFHELLFESTQRALADFLRNVPSAPGPGDDYGLSYDSLKAYLVTTSNHDRSSAMFLSPVLLKRWAAGRSPDAETLTLAQKQFDFYSEELKAENPFSAENDTLAIERARRYLSQFAGAERVYQFMLAEASRKNSPFAFNRQFPGSAEVVINSKEIAGAYTKAGWTFMQDAIKNADRYFSGEQWVLGDQGASGIDRVKLEQQLRDRYIADFSAQWHQFLRAASVVRYASIKDAAAKLNRLSSNQSPLLALLCVVSQNTEVDASPIKSAFQPVQLVVPPTCKERYIADSNAGYMQSLVALDALLEQMGNNPGGPNPALTEQVMSSALQAKVITRQLAQKFQIDPQNHSESIVQKLMEDPITFAESLIRSAGPADLNQKGKTFCSQFSELVSKYPFNSAATRQASLQELNAVFQPPQGTFWTFYEMNLQNHIARQGAQFVAKADAGVTVNPAFLNFWTRTASFAESVYPDKSPEPRLTYTLKPYPVEGIELRLTIDGQTITTAGSNPSRQFVWSGNPKSELKLTGTIGRGTELAFATYEGVWAPFQFFSDADKSTAISTGYALEWVQRQGRGGRPITLPNGMPLTIRFDLEGKTAAFFQKNFLAALSCVSDIAR